MNHLEPDPAEPNPTLARLADDECPCPEWLAPMSTAPLAPPLFPAAVYRCRDTTQAENLLAGTEAGYVYSRDGHPNARMLADKCARLHGAERALICGSGMSALSLAVLALTEPGQHVVASRMLYGRSLQLLTREATRWGLQCTTVDSCDLAATAAAFTDRTRLVVVETISNPTLRVADIRRLAELAHARGALLLVDNTFAGPTVCRPLELGADLVWESLTKIMNGHSDVLLGLLCGSARWWDRMPTVHSVWGLAPAPFDCWLALRGISTLALRAERAAENALVVARYLEQVPQVSTVYYPGLVNHPDHRVASGQFSVGPHGPRHGSVVTFTLVGGRAAADRFIGGAMDIPFCPSLGDVCTTLSHPESTSHRLATPGERAAIGIDGGTIRLSVGIESAATIIRALGSGLRAIDGL